MAYLVIPSFCTHRGGLGDAVTKMTRLSVDVVPSCPWCRAPVTDDACHAVACCMHPKSKAIRKMHTNNIEYAMARRCPGWSSAFLAADCRDKGRFLLNVACYAHMQDELRPTIVGLLISLLCEIRKAHPTFARYFKGSRLESLSYY